MRAAIVAVGSEMLGIARLDTNSLEITRHLEEWGVVLTRKSVVGDDIDEISAELRFSADRNDIVIVTGGLGPTEDDLTRDAIGKAFGLELRHDAAILEAIETRFAARNLVMSASNRKQAMVFADHEIVQNERGTAPGFHLNLERSGRPLHVWVFPGVPREAFGMIESTLAPWLRTLGLERRYWRVVRLSGLPESTADDLLKPFHNAHRDRPVTILASSGELQVHFYAEGEEKAAVAELDLMEAQVRQLLGTRVYGSGADPIEAVVGELLRARGETIAIAESCTGGLVAKRLTDAPGSSSYFLGGVVAYTAEAKMILLGVDPAHIQDHGQVSEEVARDLAVGARRRFGTDWGIGITGIAGPDGGSEDKPVGTVHIAVAGRETTFHKSFVYPVGRLLVRRLASTAALDMVRRLLLGQ